MVNCDVAHGLNMFSILSIRYLGIPYVYDGACKEVLPSLISLVAKATWLPI